MEISLIYYRPKAGGDLVERWFAVQTQPQKERLALQHLNNQNFATFCPMRRAPKRVGRRHCMTLQPFFPSYAFVRFDPRRTRWRAINSTIGVARLIAFGNEPTALPTGLVERFCELSSAGGELAFDEKMRPGDRVRIVGGAFDALCGELVTAEPRKRVTVLLELLSGATRVEVARDRLMPA